VRSRRSRSSGSKGVCWSRCFGTPVTSRLAAGKPTDPPGAANLDPRAAARRVGHSESIQGRHCG
jgi:hypothetical protein